MTMTMDLSRLLTVGTRSGSNERCSSVVVHLYDVSALRENRAQLDQLATKACELRKLIRYLVKCVDAMDKEYRDVVALNKQTVRRLEATLDEQGSESTTPTIEFMELLATGQASAALIQFLGSDLGFKVGIGDDTRVFKDFKPIGIALNTGLKQVG